MYLSTQIIFKTKDLIIYEKNNLVVIYNKKFNRHMFLSEEVYKFYKMASKENLTIGEFINYFEDKEDKNYIEQLSMNMIKSGAIYNKDYERYIEQKCIESKNIYLSITNKCNLKCKHCCTSCSIEKENFLETSQLKMIIDSIKELNPKSLVITGGEPLVRDDFKEIIEYIKYKAPHIKLILSTNGTLINNENLDFIVGNFDKIDISIDGVDEETCSITRGKGVFNKVIKAVRALQSKQFNNISLSMVFGDKNDYLKEDFINLNRELSTYPEPRYFVPSGRGIENMSLYSSKDMLTPILIPKVFEDNKYKKSKKISSCSCNALKSQLFIDHDGSIYPCQSLIKEEYKVGSIFNQDIVGIIKSQGFEKLEVYYKMQKILPYNFEKCKNCDINIFCWHCPGLLDSVKDNKEELDKWCNLMRRNLDRIIWNGDVI